MAAMRTESFETGMPGIEQDAFRLPARVWGTSLALEFLRGPRIRIETGRSPAGGSAARTQAGASRADRRPEGSSGAAPDARAGAGPRRGRSRPGGRAGAPAAARTDDRGDRRAARRPRERLSVPV